MEFAPVFLFGCVGVGAALAARQVWANQRRAMVEQFQAATQTLFEDGTFEAKLLVSRAGVLVAANEVAAGLFLWNPRALSGQRISELIPAAASIENLATQYREEQQLFGEGPELPGRRKDGSTFPMQLRFSDIRLGRDTLLLVTVRDLTSVREHDACNRELQLVSTVLQYTDVPIMLADANGRVARHNFAFEDFTGHSADAIVSMPYWELLLPPEQWESARDSLSALLAGGPSDPEDTWWNRKDGSAAGVRISMRALEGGDRGPRYALIVGVPRGEALLEPQPGVDADFDDTAENIAEPGEPNWDEWGLPPQPETPPEKPAEEESAALPAWVLPNLPVVETPVFADLDLNGLVRSQKPELLGLVGGRVRLSTILDLSLESVLADAALLSGLMQSLVWIGYRGMPDGGKISIETTCALLDQDEARKEGNLRGGSYAILTFRYACPGYAGDLQSLLFTPFEANGAGNLQMTLPALHGVLRANGGNLVVQQPPGAGPCVKVYLPMARAAVFQA
ncbi:MAG: PAS domain S-box protein [Bryobacteraceae bacterium]|nr:PAS domain S-box protein [Bryobacteraceae bacterium]